MDNGTLPTDTQGCTDALKQRKLVLMELHAEILEHTLTKAYEASGLINNYVDEIDRRLESGNLWSSEDE